MSVWPTKPTKIYYWRSEETPAGFCVAVCLSAYNNNNNNNKQIIIISRLLLLIIIIIFNSGNTLITYLLQKIHVATMLEMYSCFLQGESLIALWFRREKKSIYSFYCLLALMEKTVRKRLSIFVSERTNRHYIPDFLCSF